MVQVRRRLPQEPHHVWLQDRGAFPVVRQLRGEPLRVQFPRWRLPESHTEGLSLPLPATSSETSVSANAAGTFINSLTHIIINSLWPNDGIYRRNRYICYILGIVGVCRPGAPFIDLDSL